MKTTLCIFALILLSCARASAASPYTGYTALNPVEMELFPPDFLFAQREALGLNEAQLQEMQALVQEVQAKFEALVPQIGDRTKALLETLHQPKPEVPQAEEKLRALLAQENEMKLLQVRLMLSLRNKLTPEQVERARQLRPQVAGARSSPTDGLPQRLQAKFEKLRSVVEARAAGGEPPVELVKKAQEIQQLVQNNNPLEAERQLDALLSTLPELKPKP